MQTSWYPPESELLYGADATYNVTQPEVSAHLSRSKMENIKRTGAGEAREQGQRLAVVHPMELLDFSYRRELPRR